MARKLSARRAINQHPAPELIEAVNVTRFWRLADVRREDECWPWLGDTDDDGYGVFFYRGRMRRAHELALSFTTGEARAEGLDTCHSCDNPSCCKPADLRFASRQSNVDDMWNRDRGLAGERAPWARLTNVAIREIRARRAAGARQVDLAAEYGVSQAYISEIVNGLVWQEAGGPITGRGKRTQRNPHSVQGKAA